MTYLSYRKAKELAFNALKLASVALLSTCILNAETLSLNGTGDFDTQFTRKAGTGENRFDEVSGIGISGSRAIRRSASGSETVSYISNNPIGGLSNSAQFSVRFKYATNLTGSGGIPLFFGITTNANYNGNESGSSADDFLGVELNQRITGSNESKLTVFNGVNGNRTEQADSGFENLTPGWYEIEVSFEKLGAAFDLSIAMHGLSEDGANRTSEDLVTAAVSSLDNPDLLNSGNLHFYLGGSDTLQRGVEVIDEIIYTGTGSSTLTAPSGLVASVVSNSQINLSWIDNAKGESNYRVERRIGSGAWSEVAVLPANSVSFSNTGLSGETTYTYRVFATTSEITSNASNEFSATTGIPVPNIPVNLVASAYSMTRVDLSWTDTANNETWFRIERRVAGGPWEDLEDIVGNLESYSDTGLTANTSYAYRIRSGNAAGLSSPSNEALTTTPNVPVPSAPSNLRLTSLSVTQVSLAWNDNANDEQGFRVERKSGSGEYEQISELPAGSTSYSDTSVMELGNYMYRVYAYNANGSSAFTPPVSVDLPFLSPNSLTAEAVSQTQVDLTWNDNSAVETGYRIERKTATSPYITLVNVGNDIDSFSDRTARASISYTYRVVGISFFEFSEYTNEATAITPDQVPSAAPSDLAIDNQAFDHVVLSWIDNSSDEQGFIIQRKTGTGGYENLEVLEPGTTLFVDSQVGEMGNYTYRLVSYNEAGESAPSNEVNVQIGIIPPSDLVALVISSSQVDLSWTDNSASETGYRIERRIGQGGFETLTTLGAGVEEYVDLDVIPLSSYSYRVVAVNGTASSVASNERSVNTPNVATPGAASDLVVSVIDDSFISLEWTDNSITESGFRVERSVGGSEWDVLAVVPSNTTEFQDNRIIELNTYQYRIVSYNDGGDSTASNEASALFDFIHPTELAVFPSGDARIDLTWKDNSTVESGYRIERKPEGGVFEALSVIPQNSTSFVDLGVTLGNTYTYRVIGLYDGGESDPTNEASGQITSDTTTPNVPTGLAAIASGFSQINLTWVDTSDNETGFRIERKMGVDGEYVFIGNASADSTFFSDEDLESNTTYFYRLASFISGALASDNSEESSATTLSVPVPDAPTELAIVAENSTQISLSWNDESEAETGYIIQRRIGVGGEFLEIASLGSDITTYADSSILELEDYAYRVFAFNEGGSSSTSNEVQASVLLAAPKNVTAQAVSSSSVRIGWEDNSRVESGFRIERIDRDGNQIVVAFLPENTEEYFDGSVKPNETYTYRLVTVKNASQSLFGNLVNVSVPNISAPAAPTGLQVSLVNDSSVSVSWNDNSDNEDGFRVLRKEGDNGVWVELVEVSPNVNLYVDTNIVSGVSYSYRVAAFNEGGEESPAEKSFKSPVPGRLINISTRGLVETGDNVMIGSFIIQGNGPKTVLIRGIGPSIASSINASILQDPEITLVSGSDLNRPIAYNDDWKDTDQQRIIDVGLPPTSDLESAMVVQLQPGAYSAILSGVGYTSGFGLIEVYEVDFKNNVRMINISTRSFVEEGDRRMIGGFVIRGDSPVRVFIKASGLSLPPSIENRLEDPALELYAGQERIDTNDNWQTSDRILEILDTGIQPTNENEAAIVATLDPGSYTAILGGANNTSGYSLLEIYYYPE